jgi:hypothetical protein
MLLDDSRACMTGVNRMLSSRDAFSTPDEPSWFNFTLVSVLDAVGSKVPFPFTCTLPYPAGFGEEREAVAVAAVAGRSTVVLRVRKATEVNDTENRKLHRKGETTEVNGQVVRACSLLQRWIAG